MSFASLRSSQHFSTPPGFAGRLVSTRPVGRLSALQHFSISAFACASPCWLADKAAQPPGW